MFMMKKTVKMEFTTTNSITSHVEINFLMLKKVSWSIAVAWWYVVLMLTFIIWVMHLVRLSSASRSGTYIQVTSYSSCLWISKWEWDKEIPPAPDSCRLSFQCDDGWQRQLRLRRSHCSIGLAEDQFIQNFRRDRRWGGRIPFRNTKKVRLLAPVEKLQISIEHPDWTFLHSKRKIKCYET
jgi:hypothetical protein